MQRQPWDQPTELCGPPRLRRGGGAGGITPLAGTPANSATHAFGCRNFDCPDLSNNCWREALLNFGEVWHNHYHAFHYSARHGLRRFEFDLTWRHIRLLRRLGWPRRVRVDRCQG